MKLLIKNLGPIKNNTQEIDLSKRFYVFVGVNNSGKTYVSQLLWTIFNDTTIHRFAESQFYKELMELNISEGFLITEQFVRILLKDFADFLKNELISTYNIQKISALLQNINLSFDFDIDEFEERGTTINTPLKTQSGSIEKYLIVDKDIDSFLFTIEIKEIPKSLLEIFSGDEHLKWRKNEHNLVIKNTIIEAIIIILLNNHIHETFFLPASRSFYPAFYSYIYETDRRRREEESKKIFDLLEKQNNNKEPLNLKELRKIGIVRRQYTEPMNQVFESLFSLNLKGEETPYYLDLVKHLSEIMGGDILIKSLEGIAPIELFFKPHKQEIDLPMYLASSCVNQLSLLYLYLKYWVEEKHNFLMIDEPEENLHPTNQILLLKLLIDFANQNNNRVLITTHSPLLANALNNHVYIDILENEYDCDLDYIIEEHDLTYVDSSTSITRDDVDVYFFDGKEILEYNSGYYSIYFRDFQEISSAIEKSAETLTDYIYYMESDEDEGDEDE